MNIHELYSMNQKNLLRNTNFERKMKEKIILSNNVVTHRWCTEKEKKLKKSFKNNIH